MSSVFSSVAGCVSTSLTFVTAVGLAATITMGSASDQGVENDQVHDQVADLLNGELRAGSDVDEYEEALAVNLGFNNRPDRVDLTPKSTVYNALGRLQSSRVHGSATLLNMEEWGLTGSFIVTAGHVVAVPDTNEILDDLEFILEGNVGGRDVSFHSKVQARNVYLHPRYIADPTHPDFSQYDIALVALDDGAPDWATVLEGDFTLNRDTAIATGMLGWVYNVAGFPFDAPEDSRKGALVHYGCSLDLYGMVAAALSSQCDAASGQSGGSLVYVWNGKSVLAGVTSMVRSVYHSNDEEPDRMDQSVHTSLQALTDYIADIRDRIEMLDDENVAVNLHSQGVAVRVQNFEVENFGSGDFYRGEPEPGAM